MIDWFRKRRALKRIARRLPRDMQRRHGTTDAYTADQVRDVLERGRYDQRYWGYAFAVFLLADDAAAQVGGAGQVDAMRGEIADRYFHGDADFSLDTARLGAGGGHGFTDPGAGGFHDAGGGFDGGGGDAGGY